MEKQKLLRIMEEKVRQGWSFERIYMHLVILDDLEKESPDAETLHRAIEK